MATSLAVSTEESIDLWGNRLSTFKITVVACWPCIIRLTTLTKCSHCNHASRLHTFQKELFICRSCKSKKKTFRIAILLIDHYVDLTHSKRQLLPIDHASRLTIFQKHFSQSSLHSFGTSEVLASVLISLHDFWINQQFYTET